MADKDIELQVAPSTGDSDKRKQEEERPPTPPKRDLSKEEDKAQPDSKKKIDFKEEDISQPDGKKKKKVGLFPRPEVIYKPEKTQTYMSCLKNLFIFFNLLIWVFGAVLTAIGIWIKVDNDFWDIQTGLDMTQFSKAAYVLIACGVFIMLVGFLGCYGAYSESMCLLIVYSIIVILIILLEIAVAALVWTASNNKDLKASIKDKAKQALQKMSEDDNKRYFLDLLQSKLKCCGIDGPDEYEQYGGIPHSCTDSETGYPYEKGCLETAVSYLKSKAAVLGGIAVAVFVMQLAAIIVAIVLIVGLRQAVTNGIF